MFNHFKTNQESKKVYENRENKLETKQVEALTGTTAGRLGHLLYLPDDVMQDRIFSNLDIRTISLFAQTSSTSYHFAKTPLHEKLLSYVIEGDQTKAESVLKGAQKNQVLLSALLSHRSVVIDYSGRRIEGSAFQLAIGGDDVSIYSYREGMAEMLERYFLMLPSGAEMIKTQLLEQFPQGWLNKKITWLAQDRAALKKVICAMEEEKAKPENSHYNALEEACEPAIDTFRKHLIPSKNAVIRTGRHFNAELLIDALEFYKNRYQTLGGELSDPYYVLFWRKIIGYIQRCLPICYAQALCRAGAHRAVEVRERSLAFREIEGSFYKGSRFCHQAGLGFEYAVLAGKGKWAEEMKDMTDLEGDIELLQELNGVVGQKMLRFYHQYLLSPEPQALQHSTAPLTSQQRERKYEG